MTRAAFTLLLAGLTLAGGSAGAADLQVETTPDPLVLGESPLMTLTVKGLPGKGAVLGDVNVGEVERIEAVGGDAVRVRYRPPKKLFPQTLCLLLWRDADIEAPIHIFRLPLYGKAEIPVKTRSGATVRVILGDREHGPVTTGATGRALVPVQVPPGVRVARVEVTSKTGLRSSRRVAVSQTDFNQLAMAITPRSLNSPGSPRFRITLAVADLDRATESPLLELGDERLALEERGRGRWTGVWAPSSRPGAGRIPIRAHIPGDLESERYAEMGISPAELTVKLRRVRPRPRPGPPRRLQADIGVAVGVSHNLGELVAPRFGVEVGLEYRLAPGLVGIRVLAAFGWASQQVQAEGSLEDAESTVMMVPVGAVLSYRAPLRHLSPYVLWGCMAHILRTSTRAPYLSPKRERTDVVFGVLGAAGASRHLGPGRLFLQLGYLWSEVDNEDVAALAGGLVLEGGYRLEL